MSRKDELYSAMKKIFGEDKADKIIAPLNKADKMIKPPYNGGSVTPGKGKI